MKPISMDAYVAFLRDYYNQKENKYKGQRLGQAFLNEFFPDVADPSLFYEGDDVQAGFKIMEYIEEKQA